MARSSVSPKISLRFRREVDLVNVVRTKGHQFLFPHSTRNLTVFSEFESNHGVADLVFVKLPNRWEEALELAKLHPNWAYIFVLLGKKSFDVVDIQRLSGCSKAYAKTILSDLECSSVLRKLKSDRWKVSGSITPIAKEIVSIECKLKNWKRALAQAIRYQDFSNSSWVVLDANATFGARQHISMFRKFNIGLALVDSAGGFEILNSPNYMAPKHISAFWFANSIAAKTIEQSYFINSL